MEKKSGKPKILMFLTDTLLGMILEKTFVRAGFEVKLFFTYLDIVDLVAQEEPDILLCDVLLDKTKEGAEQMDGFQAISFLKRFNKTKDIPIIVLTDLCYTESKNKGLKIGAKDYLCLAEYPPYKALQVFINYLIESGKFTKKDFNFTIE